jgi:hypothetical protein
MAKSQVQERQANGLIAQPNPLTASEGSLTLAENVVVDRDGVTGKRRGFDRYEATAGRASSLSEYANTLIVHQGTDLLRDSAGTLVAYSGSFTPPDSNRMKFNEVRRGLFFTTSNGVYKLDSLGGTPARAGMPAGLDISLAASTGTTNWLANDTAVGYRVLWLRKDANNQFIPGGPSSQVRIANSSGLDKMVTLTTTIPPGVVAGDFLEIYRTFPSASATTSPGDDHFLVVQQAVTSSDISAGVVIYADETLAGFLGLPLYTNANEETILQANDRPPWCTDICTYKGYTYYLNTKREQRKDIALKDIAGIADNSDSVTFTFSDLATLTYTFSTIESAAFKKFQRFTALTTLPENVRETMLSFCRVINRDPSNTRISAYYISGELDNPGKVLIKCREISEGQFYITATAGCGANFTPSLPTVGTSISSDNLQHSNRMYWSKFEQPEAVPEDNFQDIGAEKSSGAAILRAFALQASMLILKEDGFWRQTGEDTASFDIRPLDNTRVVCPDAADVLDNNVHCVTLQGLAKASENGVAITGWPIEKEFKKVFSFPNFEILTHAIAYQSDRKFIVFAQERSTDTYPTVAWIYNFVTSKWVTWRKPAMCAHVLEADDKLYLGHAVDNYILRERKSYGTDLNDFKDESIPVMITAVGTALDSSGLAVTTADVDYSYTTTLVKGFSLEQPATHQTSNVASVEGLGGTSYRLILEEEMPVLVPGPAYLALPIVSIIRWKPEACGNAALSKHFSTSQIYFEDDSALHHEIAYEIDHHEFGFYTDVVGEINYYQLVLKSTTGWGIEPQGWGEFGWGDDDPSNAPIARMYIPTQYETCRALAVVYRHSTARETFSILNMALTYRPLSEVTTLAPR